MTPYEMRPEVLLETILLMSGRNQTEVEMRYYKGAAVARMYGARSPFKPGNKVRVKNSTSVSSMLGGPTVLPRAIYTVGWMFYDGRITGGKDLWRVGFVEILDQRGIFDADTFELLATPTK